MSFAANDQSALPISARAQARIAAADTALREGAISAEEHQRRVAGYTDSGQREAAGLPALDLTY